MIHAHHRGPRLPRSPRRPLRLRTTLALPPPRRDRRGRQEEGQGPAARVAETGNAAWTASAGTSRKTPAERTGSQTITPAHRLRPGPDRNRCGPDEYAHEGDRGCDQGHRRLSSLPLFDFSHRYSFCGRHLFPLINNFALTNQWKK